jgi:hypothetical protein
LDNQAEERGTARGNGCGGARAFDDIVHGD